MLRPKGLTRALPGPRPCGAARCRALSIRRPAGLIEPGGPNQGIRSRQIPKGPAMRALLVSGAPEGIRTPDLCLRRAALYPAELRAHPANHTSFGCCVRTPLCGLSPPPGAPPAGRSCAAAYRLRVASAAPVAIACGLSARLRCFKMASCNPMPYNSPLPSTRMRAAAPLAEYHRAYMQCGMTGPLRCPA